MTITNCSLSGPICPAKKAQTAMPVASFLSMLGRFVLAAMSAACLMAGTAAAPAGAAGTVATSDDHSCAVQPLGHVVCWGSNAYGQLGDGTTISTLKPVSVAGLEGATAVGVGVTQSCALKSDGTVVCWGVGGATVQAPIHEGLAATDIVHDFTALSVDSDSAFALRQSGLVRCWQAGSTSSSAVDRVSGATSIDLDSQHLCVTRPLKPVLCRLVFSGSLNTIADGTITGMDGATAVAASPDHLCSIVGGAVRCHGRGQYGALGGGDKVGTSKTETPVFAIGVDDAVQIQTGARHSCALRSNGRVLCWGYGLDGQTGRDPARGSLTPITVPGLIDVTAIAAYGDHTCATTAVGATRCWGNSPAYPLNSPLPCRYTSSTTQICWPRTLPGYQTFATPPGPAASPYTVPTPGRPATGLTGTVALSAGGSSSCAATTSGTVSCWGRGYNGNGTSARSFGPVGTGALTGVTSVSVSAKGSYQTIPDGPTSACALRANGTVACWGVNSDFQSAPAGPPTPVLSPVTVPIVTSAVDVAVGGLHACALLGNGHVTCWGDNSDFADRKTESGAITDAVAISAGDTFTCVLLRDHHVACWGSSQAGRLGRLGGRAYGAPVTGLTDAVAISAHGDHACALRARGRVACWGADDFGQDGAPTPTDGGLWWPHTLTGITDAVAIGTGTSHSCAVRAGGGVVCWGKGSDGQLGNGNVGSNANTSTPTPVVGITDAVALSGGTTHTCATRRSGSVVCWGRGNDGQVGDRTPYPRAPTLTVVPGSIVPTLVAP